MDMIVTLGGVIYNTRHIVSFRKASNVPGDIFIVLQLSVKVGHETSIKYDTEKERTDAFKLLMSCFDN